MRLGLFFVPLPFVLSACSAPVPPPRFPVPSADDALVRAKASATCGRAVQASAKIDVLSDRGRFRGETLLFAARPESLRMDIVSPFGATLATLTSDGQTFALADLRDKRFLVGPPEACNIARFTAVPLPGHVLVGLLLGLPPVLRHERGQGTVRWSDKGFYVVTVPSTRGADEELAFEPHPDDRERPWQEQRLRLREVTVRQAGRVAWRAELEGHAPAPMAGPREDPDHLEPPLPPSGPACTAELPRRLHVEVPDDGQDVLFRYDQVTWNPPLPEGTFVQPKPPGMREERVTCEPESAR